MKVEALMARNVGSCMPDDTLNAAAQIMWERDCGCVPVVVPGDGGLRVVGMLTDRDVAMAAYTQGRPLDAVPVSSAMSRDVRSCRTGDSIGTVLRVMGTNQLHRLPVVDADEHLVGVLSLADLARQAAHEHGRKAQEVSADQVGETVEAISEPRSPREVAAA